MKSNYFKSGLIAIFVIAFCVAQAAIYHSTTAGGNWHVTTTWQEGIVPTATDDVVITGPGTVIIYNSGHECNNLTVESGATLRNYTNGNRVLIVNGNVINNGTITDPNYSLTLNIAGNLTNNGVWSNKYTNLTGAGTHILSQGPATEFTGTNFTAAASTGNITSLTDLLFNGTNIDLNGDTLIMPAVTGTLLRLTGGRIMDGNIQANGGNLIMYSGAYIGANLIITDLYSLDGTVVLNGTGIEFSGNIINFGVIQNYNNVNSSLNINGNIINNGTITDPNYYLNLHITGNITNNGVWSNRYTNLTGTGTHILSQGSGAEFSGTNFTAVTSTGNITSLTDLTFNGTYVDLNGDTLYMATTGSLLSFTAGRIE
ncbi:MAG: hypothetical protein K8R37_04465, partial [Bacteroidales bacterium]|nr:hypothetical protein [Bacteroidales bacterium]